MFLRRCWSLLFFLAPLLTPFAFGEQATGTQSRTYVVAYRTPAGAADRGSRRVTGKAAMVNAAPTRNTRATASRISRVYRLWLRGARPAKNSTKAAPTVVRV